MCILVVRWDEIVKRSLSDFALWKFSNGDKKPHSKAIVDAATVADINISFNFRFIVH